MSKRRRRRGGMARRDEQSHAGAPLNERLLCDLKNITEVPTRTSDIFAIKCRATDGKRFAHCSMLSVCSPFFAEILKQPRKASLELDVSAEIFDIILEFIYMKRRLEFEPRYALELLTAAQLLRMDNLAKEVEKKLTTEDKYRGLREVFARILSNGSGGDAVSAAGSGAASSATPCRCAFSNRCELYAVACQEDIGRSTMTIRDLKGHRESTCHTFFTLEYSSDMAIRQGQLFVAAVFHDIRVFDVSTNVEVQRLRLVSARGATLFGSDVYVFNLNGEVFLVDGAAEEMSLKQVADSPIYGVHRMLVVRKTGEEFHFAIQTALNVCFLISKAGSQLETWTGMANSKCLLGSHDGHVFTSVELNNENDELLDFLNGEVVRRWKVNGNLDFPAMMLQMRCYYAEREVGDNGAAKFTVKVLDLRTGKTKNLWHAKGEPRFVRVLN